MLWSAIFEGLAGSGADIDTVGLLYITQQYIRG
jgi:hypothetical protein